MCNCSQTPGKQCKQCVTTCIKYPQTPLYNPCGCNCNPCYPDHSCCNPCNKPRSRRRYRKYNSKRLLEQIDYDLLKKKTNNDLIMDNILNSIN